MTFEETSEEAGRAKRGRSANPTSASLPLEDLEDDLRELRVELSRLIKIKGEWRLKA
jgi:hypothetical protein